MIMMGERLENKLFALAIYISCELVCQERMTDIIRFLTVLYLLRQMPLIHNAQFSKHLCPVADWHCPLFCGFKGCQIQGFEQGCIAWKYASLAVEFPIGGIKRFYGIGRIDYFPDSCGKLKNWRNGIPVVFPAFHILLIYS